MNETATPDANHSINSSSVTVAWGPQSASIQCEICTNDQWHWPFITKQYLGMIFSCRDTIQITILLSDQRSVHFFLGIHTESAVDLWGSTSGNAIWWGNANARCSCIYNSMHFICKRRWKCVRISVQVMCMCVCMCICMCIRASKYPGTPTPTPVQTTTMLCNYLVCSIDS